MRFRNIVPVLALALAPLAQATASLDTVAERSGFSRTGRYEEVPALCEAFAGAHPDRVRCLTFGTTPEGRPMKLLVATSTGAFEPQDARARGIPVTLMQGGIHAGEIDGKDAGFLALRELLEGRAAKGALDRQVFLFVPVFNVDGHERFKAWNRPNQRGPEEMGWRTTAANLNLNRDYMKADAPEMQAVLRLIDTWDPLVYVDLHATNGAKFEHDISIQVEPVNSGDAQLREAGRGLRSGTIARLAKQGSMPLPFYPSFVVDDDPASGFEDGVATPRFSHGYMPLRNRIGMLVETHSWRTYPERVRATRNTIVAVLEQVARDGRRWLDVARAADARAARLGGDSVALDYRATGAVRTIEFRGYEYSRTPSAVSGALMTRYDESRPQVWKVPLRDVIEPRTVAAAPRAGYLVPPAWADRVAAKLDVHGVRYQRLPAAIAGVDAQAWRAGSMRFAADSLEGRQRLALDGGWAPERQDVPAGALFVPIAQPLARVAMGLLEPAAPDALVAWGLFNTAFERKEYMEAYVAEEEAGKMLAADPALREEFERRLREDPEFAANPRARLDFFYRRHAAWDDRFGLYPVLRLDRDPR